LEDPAKVRLLFDPRCTLKLQFSLNAMNRPDTIKTTTGHIYVVVYATSAVLSHHLRFQYAFRLANGTSYAIESRSLLACPRAAHWVRVHEKSKIASVEISVIPSPNVDADPKFSNIIVIKL
jgi:hypothetical protein